MAGLVGPATVAVNGGAERRFALHLTHLRPDRRLDREALQRDAVAFVTALEGQDDVSFCLQMVVRPDLAVAERGRIDVHLIVGVCGQDGAEPTDDRIEEVADDLLDLLGAPPLRWGFQAVTDEATLKAALDPVEVTHLAEIARSEDDGVRASQFRPAGFGATLDAGDSAAGSPDERELWTLWHLGRPSPDLYRLAAVLLAQEAPVAIRVTIRPTVLGANERNALEDVLYEYQRGPEPRGLVLASLRTLESVLYLRPLFEARLVVASPDRLSRSLTSAIGHAVSEPPEAVKTDGDELAGGFSVLRAGNEVDDVIARSAYDMDRRPVSLPSLAPAPLVRLRSILGAWETANLFRIPVTDTDFPGITSLRVPDLVPPLGLLPRAGTPIGDLVGFGGSEVFLEGEERFRHAYVSGQTGTGKSTLMLNMAMSDVEAGAGVVVLDPHGDLIEALLARIPDERTDDVVLIDPADPDAVVGFNLLDADSEVQRAYVLTELSNMFETLFDPNHEGIVGPRFHTIFRQCAGLLMANPQVPSSLLDTTTPLADTAVRNYLLEGVTDPLLLEFWNGEMKQNRSNDQWEVIAWVRSKFEVFRTSQHLRNVIGQTKSTVSFSDVLNRQRILLVNLSKGLLGEYNSAMLGYLVFMRLWSAALERASMPRAERRPVFVYIDEFQNMTNQSLPDVLSEARKFNVGLTLANQFFTQVPVDTRDALMGNVSTRVTFRMGPKDAHPFAQWLGPEVNGEDLTVLPNFTGVVAMSQQGVPLPPFVLKTRPPTTSEDEARAARVRARSNEQWARPVAGLDEEFLRRWVHVPGSFAQLASQAAGQKLATAGHGGPPDPDGPGADASSIDDWAAWLKALPAQESKGRSDDPTQHP